jgi:SagB-type dehydrogenase family enzyme
MKLLINSFLFIFCFFWTIIGFAANEVINLPKPEINATFSLDKALQERRSVRDYTSQELSQQQISQLLWAGDGISNQKKKLRTAPSAWETYPLNLYLVKADGVWQYDTLTHSIRKLANGDMRQQLKKACMEQKQITKAQDIIVITMQNNKLSNKMGIDNSKRFALLEAGCVTQNILLEATALGLAGVPMTGFVDQEVRSALTIPEGQEAVFVIPVGYKK